MAKRDITKRPRRALSAEERQTLFREFKLGIFALTALVVLVVALRWNGRGAERADARARNGEKKSGAKLLKIVWKPRAAGGERPSEAPRRDKAREPARRPDSPRPPRRRSVPPPVPAYRSYVVKRGDTFWRIAQRQLGDGRRWPLIKKANPGINPKRLKRGTVLRIPLRNSSGAPAGRLAGAPAEEGGHRLLHSPTPLQ